MGVKIVLQQDVPNLGQVGEIKTVAAGYFRNFLQPRGLAVEATKGKLQSLATNATVKTAQKGREHQREDALARRIEDAQVSIPVKLGQQGRIYGSVTNRDLSEALQQQAGIEIDRHKIELSEPLKSVGVHSVPIKLEHGIEAHLRVELVPEGETAEV